MAISNEKATPLLALALAGIVGYCAYTGTVIDMVGLNGLAAGKERVVAIRDTITRFEAATDSAKKELARGSIADVRKRLLIGTIAAVVRGTLQVMSSERSVLQLRLNESDEVGFESRAHIRAIPLGFGLRPSLIIRH